LGIFACGLHLGLPLQTMHGGLDRLLSRIHDVLPGWVPQRITRILELDPTTLLILLLFALPAALCYLFVKRPLRFGLGVSVLVLVNTFCDLLEGDVLLRQRSFFGVLQVTDRGSFRRLEHGTTLHGQQRISWSQSELAAGAAGLLAVSDSAAGAVF